MFKKAVEFGANWMSNYKEALAEHKRTHEQLLEIKRVRWNLFKKYWYIWAILVTLFTAPIVIMTIWQKKKDNDDELEQKLADERRYDKRYYKMK